MGRFSKFGLKESTYQRPTQKWTCGNTCEGRSCTNGPNAKGECTASSQCTPEKKKDRWYCTRPELLGGECETGPSPSGECCKKIATCTPVLNTRFNRGRFVLGLCIVGISFLLFLVFSPFSKKMMTPGHLSEVHRSLEQNCDACHSAVEKGLVANIVDLHKGFDDNSKCLTCHSYGENADSTHNLAKLKDSHGSHSCTECHKEHKGEDASIINTKSCLSCHKDAMQDGHSQFSNYPFKRRTRMTFDHKSHFGKFFKEKGGFAPEKCSACHILSPTGKNMLVKSFSLSCSACHENQIVDKQKKYDFISLPYLDTESLSDVGEWPEDAEGEITPFMKLLLSDDKEFTDSYNAIKDVELDDLTDVSDEQKKHVQKVIWKVKDLLFQMANKKGFIKEKLTKALANQDNSNSKELSQFDIPDTVIKNSANKWFPKLKQEIRVYKSGDLSKLKEIKEEEKKAPVKKEDSDKVEIGPGGEIKIDDVDIGADGEIKIDDVDIGADGEIKVDEIDIGGDGEIKIDEIDIGTGEIDINAAVEEPTTQVDVDVNVELVKVGQWDWEDFSISYTPESHADKVLRYWLINSINKKDESLKDIFDSLKDPVKSPGLCLKCHSVDDIGGKQIINWHAKRPQANLKNHTQFDHSSHTKSVIKEGCVSCHNINSEADYMKAFKGNYNPFEFVSNFNSINKNKCFDCHTNNSPGKAASCTECHNYHVGSFKNALEASAIKDVIKETKKDEKEK